MNNYDLGYYFKEEEAKPFVVTEELKEELFFEFSGFKKGKVTKEIETLAHLIEHLLLLEKNTYPDAPDLGIDIKSFEFEIMNSDTLNDLKNKITSQIDTYIDTSYIGDIVVQKIDNEYINNGLGIGFSISTNGNYDSDFFILIFKDEETREIISKIIL